MADMNEPRMNDRGKGGGFNSVTLWVSVILLMFVMGVIAYYYAHNAATPTSGATPVVTTPPQTPSGLENTQPMQNRDQSGTSATTPASTDQSPTSPSGTPDTTQSNPSDGSPSSNNNASQNNDYQSNQQNQ